MHFALALALLAAQPSTSSGEPQSERSQFWSEHWMLTGVVSLGASAGATGLGYLMLRNSDSERSLARYLGIALVGAGVIVLPSLGRFLLYRGTYFDPTGAWLLGARFVVAIAAVATGLVVAFVALGLYFARSDASGVAIGALPVVLVGAAALEGALALFDVGEQIVSGARYRIGPSVASVGGRAAPMLALSTRF
jgi:hypothetical protein